MIKQHYTISQYSNLVSFLLSNRESCLIFSTASFNPNVAICAYYHADRRLCEKFNYVVFHSPYVVVVNFHQHAIFQFAVFRIPSLDLDAAVKRADLLHLSDDQIAFYEMVSHMQLVLFYFASLYPSGQVNRS